MKEQKSFYQRYYKLSMGREYIVSIKEHLYFISVLFYMFYNRIIVGLMAGRVICLRKLYIIF